MGEMVGVGVDEVGVGELCVGEEEEDPTFMSLQVSTRSEFELRETPSSSPSSLPVILILSAPLPTSPSKLLSLPPPLKSGGHRDS